VKSAINMDKMRADAAVRSAMHLSSSIFLSFAVSVSPRLSVLVDHKPLKREDTMYHASRPLRLDANER